MNIQIRKLRPDESNAYREIRLACLKNYPENFGSNYEDEMVKEKLFFQGHIEQSDADNFVIGANNNGKIIGISGFNRYENIKTKHRGRIIQVYVDPEYQGQNIGSNIIRSTINEAFKISGIEQIEIDVLTTNKKAENVYKKIGFEEYGLQKNFLKIGNTYYHHKMMMIFKDEYISS